MPVPMSGERPCRARASNGRRPRRAPDDGPHATAAYRSTKETDGTMLDEITLRGITWDHPRGLDPLLAASGVYADLVPGVRVEWTTRSLSGFGEDPLIDLAASYDLLIIDHPFVGDAAAARHSTRWTSWLDLTSCSSASEPASARATRAISTPGISRPWPSMLRPKSRPSTSASGKRRCRARGTTSSSSGPDSVVTGRG